MRRRVVRQDVHAQRRADAAQAHPLRSAALLVFGVLEAVRPARSLEEAHAHPPTDTVQRLFADAVALRVVRGGGGSLAELLVPVILCVARSCIICPSFTPAPDYLVSLCCT